MESIGMMRDLDQIRERDDRKESSRVVLIALGGLSAACVLFAAGVLIGRESEPSKMVRREDPLARLDALANQTSSPGMQTVTYPGRLMESPAPPAAANAPPAIPPVSLSTVREGQTAGDSTRAMASPPDIPS